MIGEGTAASAVPSACRTVFSASCLRFSELFEVLKNATACRKEYFDTLTGRKYLLPACFFTYFLGTA